MKYSMKFVLIFSVSALLFLSGCATNRSVLNLQLSDSEFSASQSGAKLFVNSVSDQRAFEENPRTQDVPSLGFGGAGNATSDIKKRAVGRKRNGYGKALGDILLQEGQTVESVIEYALKKSFSKAGYLVLNSDENIDNETIFVDAEIQKFWAYMTPGFWAITLSSDISTRLKLTQKSSNDPIVEEVSVRSEGKYQVATEGNWVEIIDKSINKYISEAQKVVSGINKFAKSN
jgi:hypothetical protein